MAIRKLMARSHKVYINTNASDYTVGDWIVVSGLNSITWSEESSTVDTTDFDSGGYQTEFVITRGATLSFEGHMLVDENAGTRDSGQHLCDVAAHNFGVGGSRYVKVEAVKSTDRSQAIGHIILLANFKKGDLGGGMEDINSFSMECTMAGETPRGSGIYDLFSNT